GYGGYYDDYYYGGYDSAPRQGQVYVSGMNFSPPEVHSPAGARVLWLFQDGDIPHTVTANNGSFDSGSKVNDEYQLRFDHPGTYSYHCAIHPNMKGTVVIH
ncbi:MAG: plastocyanin/azurin family copper-binding protein, partial [Acidimicrobiia bacterium]